MNKPRPEASVVEAEIVSLLRSRREGGGVSPSDVILLDKPRWLALYRDRRPDEGLTGSLEIDGHVVAMSRYYRDICAVVPKRLLDGGQRGIVIIAEAGR